jgi:hypothetical protein
MAPKKITIDASGRVRTIQVTEGNVEIWLDKLVSSSFVSSDSVEIIDFESLVDGGKYTLGPLQLEQQLQQLQPWYLVKGTVEFNKTATGVRFNLIKLAAGGYCPRGKSVDQAQAHPVDEEKRVNSVSVVFEEKSLQLNSLRLLTAI